MKKTLTLIALNLLPVVAFAQTENFEGNELKAYIGTFTGFINQTIIPAIIALAILVFIWGMFQYFILGAADDEKKGKGKQLMLWGLIGFVVMFSLLGIIQLLVKATGLNGGNIDTLIPKLPGGTS